LQNVLLLEVPEIFSISVKYGVIVLFQNFRHPSSILDDAIISSMEESKKEVGET